MQENIVEKEGIAKENKRGPFEMSEIRKHYFLSEYCIIAEERAKRPSDFTDKAEYPGKDNHTSCIFCRGAEKNTPLATAVYKNGKIFEDTPNKRIRDWDLRCFPNQYPVLSAVPALIEYQEIGLQAQPGYGFHEVIIESPLHDRKLEDFSNIELSELMNVYRDRTCSYISREKIRYVSLFKNSGKASGASIDHPHSQLIALPFYPPSFEKEIKIIKEREKCPYCEIFERERVSPRLIFENSECIAFAPYSSMGPYEVWVLPRRHVNFLGDCNEKLLFSLGDILRSVLKSFGKIFEDIPFNYMFYQAFETFKYHLNLRLLPRLSITGGFELNTGVYINTISPERAASHLRGNLMPQE